MCGRQIAALKRIDSKSKYRRAKMTNKGAGNTAANTMQGCHFFFPFLATVLHCIFIKGQMTKKENILSIVK